MMKHLPLQIFITMQKKYSNNEPNSKILTEAELARVSDWQEGDSFELTEEGTYVVYVKAVDKAGNVTYVSSSGLIVMNKNLQLNQQFLLSQSILRLL